MANFLRPNKTKLKNAQHYSLIQAFLTVLGQAEFAAAKIAALVGQLAAAFQEEDGWYMIARKSELVAQREEADKRRDNLYSRLHAIIRAWAGSGMAVLDAAATRLKKSFDLYKVKTSAQMEEETGQLDNLISDISTTEAQDDLAALNCAWLFRQMQEQHELVKSIRLEEGTEVSEKVPGALAAARKACDRIYDELTYLIEAFSLTADDATQYEAFIKKWNGTLKIYQDMLDRKQQANAAQNGSQQNGSQTDFGSGGSGSGSGSGSGDIVPPEGDDSEIPGEG